MAFNMFLIDKSRCDKCQKVTDEPVVKLRESSANYGANIILIHASCFEKGSCRLISKAAHEPKLDDFGR